MNDDTQEKQARPIFRFLAGIVSLLFYAVFLGYCSFIYIVFDNDIKTMSYLIIPVFILVLFLPIAISFSFLAIKGAIPKKVSNFTFGRKILPGKRFFK